MKVLLFLIQKEFIQVLRNKTLLPLIFIMPLVQLLVLVYAADMNMKEINYSVYDEDGSFFSRQLQDKYFNSPFFKFQDQLVSENQVEHQLKTGIADLIIHIPKDFEINLRNNEPEHVEFRINGINSSAAVLISAYAQNILGDFTKDILLDQSAAQSTINSSQIGVSYRHWYNPELDYKIYMVPGILVLLVSMIGWILTALNIVREKEIGTIEQINVTPIRKSYFIVGKLLPFWMIAMFELVVGLTIGKLLFGIPIVGSIGLLFLFTAIYLIVPLGFGLLISSVSQNQQQVMFLAFFFIITFILMSGLFTPAESMPDWAQFFNYLNPLAYFMRVIRMIILKGSGLVDILPDLIGISIYSVFILSLAIMAYRKRV
jgi:ABC-2 type transport system permease protein